MESCHWTSYIKRVSYFICFIKLQVLLNNYLQQVIEKTEENNILRKFIKNALNNKQGKFWNAFFYTYADLILIFFFKNHRFIINETQIRLMIKPNRNIQLVQ